MNFIGQSNQSEVKTNTGEKKNLNKPKTMIIFIP